MHTLKARSGLDIIPRSECLRLLAGRRVGRLGVVVDDLDHDAGGGWSVLVKGIGEELTEVDDWFAESLRELAPNPPVWGADHYVRIRPLQITGRRLHARR